MRDDKGKKIKSYSNGYMMVNAGGPTIIFNSDGTYKKIFTPQNADTGFWRFDSLKMYIHYDLYIDSTDWVGKDLIKTGEAVKYPNGNYYEKIQDKILRYDDPELILDERGSQMVFKKQ
ncbi:hypothetical protein A8C56_21595 [Niabella ginsenosidivorans]|uniref:Uncharacterized protein n=1 Tax=Niabella ginsenosidivorans TaxID=1176587 RepID=A0A1A9I9L6_9BACT|nr:hypothetical protein [Niabella ginsenosidivorans]ANH83224.1 hypothetical protein A8C56_21595 [Niabella ginsenosidivorans]